MKARRILWAAVLATAGLSSTAQAQNPAAIAQAAGAPPAAIAGAGAVPTTATEPTTLWSFLGLSKKQKEECRRKCCESPCGQLIGKFLAPASMFTGGVIPPFCPTTPSLKELADEGVVGDAAKIKAEEAQAKARRAAVRYLGTVDCVRFPAAKDGLIKALRTDTNECVRFEAALALGNGCCCNNETMEVLAIAAACSNRDGNPREASERVRAASVAALQNCLSCFVDPNPPKPAETIGETKTGEQPGAVPPAAEPIDPPKAQPQTGAPQAGKDAAKAPPARPTGMAYYAQIAKMPQHLIIAEARRTVERYNQHASAEVILGRESSFASALNRAFDDSGPSYIMENGVPVARAEVVSQRPQSLWDMVSRPATVSGPVVIRDAGPALSAEPPMVVANNAPMPINRATEPAPLNAMKPAPLPINSVSDPAPVNAMKPMPINTINEPVPFHAIKPAPMPSAGSVSASNKPEPMNKINMAPAGPPKAATWPQREPTLPGNTGPYGEWAVYRPKTNAELASNAKPTAKVETPAPLPPAVALVPIKPETHEVMKPAAPVAVKPAVSPLAERALTVFAENHPAAVRDSIADSLAASDLNTSAELVTTLIATANNAGAESTRKAAIRALVRCNVNKPEVITTLESLSEDKEAGVRVEAAIGLARLKIGARK